MWWLFGFVQLEGLNNDKCLGRLGDQQLEEGLEFLQIDLSMIAGFWVISHSLGAFSREDRGRLYCKQTKAICRKFSFNAYFREDDIYNCR